MDTKGPPHSHTSLHPDEASRCFGESNLSELDVCLGNKTIGLTGYKVFISDPCIDEFLGGAYGGSSPEQILDLLENLVPLLLCLQLLLCRSLQDQAKEIIIFGWYSQSVS